ncbi:DUF3943 domain-containing protein [Shewanella olleyana]|uniref:DUF3943 domain-containing protein n=1 Tax=Shewanella olleyana TaxID=135626 RepID=UPI00200DBB6B|nr:DUF3943 domain-containing protein [Shewanella olleyana]MCL1067663.1 DUF3943 domain-containing protein [Shewanella olleyana]
MIRGKVLKKALLPNTLLPNMLFSISLFCLSNQVYAQQLGIEKIEGISFSDEGLGSVAPESLSNNVNSVNLDFFNLANFGVNDPSGLSRSSLAANSGNTSINSSGVSEGESFLTDPQLVDKNWWGALAEVSTLLVIGEVLYLSSEESMEGDFDYEIEGDTGQYFVDRIVSNDSWKLDDNKVGMNWGHTYAGALYYQAFRNYNFNYYESLAGNFVASAVWEVFAEYKEVVSVNDQIVTTFGGAVLGESLLQLSEMLDSKQGWLPTTFASVFNPAKTIKGWFGYDNPQRFNREYAKDKFNIYTGAIYSTKQEADIATTSLILGLEASIDSVQGKFDGLSATPSQVELNMELGISNEGIEDWQMDSSVFLGGWTSGENILLDSKNGLNTWFLGPSMGLEYSSLGQDEEEDFYAAINVIGLSAGSQWFVGDVNISIRGDLFADFSMVKPFATKNYRQNGGLFWGTKSVLWEGGYGYALGHTAKLKLEANYKELLLGVKFQSQRWDSIDDNEFNRSSDWNPNVNDLDFKDARDRYETYLDVPLTDNMNISIHHERIDRSGTLTGIENLAISNRNDETESRSSIQFVYQY